MTAPRGQGGPPPGGQSGMPSAVRGAVLVGLAVIAGIVGLQILDDSGPGSGSTTPVLDTTVTTIGGTGTTGTTVATSGAPATTVAGGATSTTTAKKPRSPGNVKVKVYNASGVPGVAQAMTDRLKAAGYNTLAPANLDKTRTGSVVSCRSGFENDGKLIAIYQVKNNATYEAFPNDPPEGSGDADCLVILGKAA